MNTGFVVKYFSAQVNPKLIKDQSLDFLLQRNCSVSSASLEFQLTYWRICSQVESADRFSGSKAEDA